MSRACRVWVRVGVGALLTALAASAQPPEGKKDAPAKKAPEQASVPEPPPGTILRPGEYPIDLATALKLAGAENPELLLARQRVTEAVAGRQLAAAQALPNLNVGSNFAAHRGVLQQSSGNVLKVDRDSLYVGLGAGTVGAGTVSLPGLNYNLNIGAGWYGLLTARQRVTTAAAAADAVRNDVLLRTYLAYLDLLRADGRRAIAARNRDEGAELARLTAAYAKAGQGRKADADRAAVELRRRDADLTQSEADTLAASARLCQLLNLDPATRLKPIDGWVVPAPLVPDPTPLPDLLAVAMMQRPELAARRSEVREALYQLSLARALPFSPNVILGFSAGGFGGGSDLVNTPPGVVLPSGARGTASRFGNLDGRSDFDAAVFLTFRNLGVGNVAQARAANSRAKQSQLRELETLNLVRTQVAEAHARAAARFLQIDAAERAVKFSSDAFDEDLTRIKAGAGFPLEVIDSLRLLGRSRFEYLDAIIDYNRAQIQLWVSVGQPPADALARPVPAGLVPPPVVEVQPGPRPFPVPRTVPLPAKP
ncbi:TolC family protein [Gemmata sp. JC717]|uniref:TolC family protein n=1 Tax=Gemmata algarum TaxID=2975278 RepID=UPI0021BAEB5D|nr:TolC family protein [Gemmata algarum]MDY3554271.1 TolC family protein [Gemmata algarum]